MGSEDATVEEFASGGVVRSKHNTMDDKEELAATASLELEKPAAPAAMAAAATEAADTAGEEEKLRLPQKFVPSWMPEVSVDPDEYYALRINDPLFSREYVERSTQTLRDVAEMTKRAWMLADCEEEGYVVVDLQDSQESEEEDEDEYPETFGPMEGLIADDTPQSVIDEIEARIRNSKST